ncbi:hypothetical protein HLV35_07440 [Eggerthellaceae bacterium zg-997]|nr:hypothetical protein [Eggerthellaceae bacterium zg-997]
MAAPMDTGAILARDHDLRSCREGERAARADAARESLLLAVEAQLRGLADATELAHRAHAALDALDEGDDLDAAEAQLRRALDLAGSLRWRAEGALGAARLALSEERGEA